MSKNRKSAKVENNIKNQFIVGGIIIMSGILLEILIASLSQLLR